MHHLDLNQGPLAFETMNDISINIILSQKYAILIVPWRLLVHGMA